MNTDDIAAKREVSVEVENVNFAAPAVAAALFDQDDPAERHNELMAALLAVASQLVAEQACIEAVAVPLKENLKNLKLH